LLYFFTGIEAGALGGERPRGSVEFGQEEPCELAVVAKKFRDHAHSASLNFFLSRFD
jgi:hypothetical protein